MLKKVAAATLLVAVVMAVGSAEARYVQSCSTRWVPDYPVYQPPYYPPVYQPPIYQPVPQWPGPVYNPYGGGYGGYGNSPY